MKSDTWRELNNTRQSQYRQSATANLAMLEIVSPPGFSRYCLSAGHELRVFVQPVNNQPPVVTVKPVQVFENGYVIFMPNDLDATDADTSDESLTFTVQRPPRSGKLKLHGKFILSVDF